MRITIENIITEEETKELENIEVETKESVISENNQTGTYVMFNRSINWNLDLSSETITLNIVNKPELGTKIITKENTIVRFSDFPHHHMGFSAEISGDYKLKQLLLNGYVIYNYHPPRSYKKKTYTDVIITSW